MQKLSVILSAGMIRSRQFIYIEKFLGQIVRVFYPIESVEIIIGYTDLDIYGSRSHSISSVYRNRQAEYACDTAIETNLLYKPRKYRKHSKRVTT